MKSDEEIAMESSAAMDEALEQLEEAQIAISDIYATVTLYAYNKWLGNRWSTKELVQEFLKEQGI